MLYRQNDLMTHQDFNPVQNSFLFSIRILITLALLLPHSSFANEKVCIKDVKFLYSAANWNRLGAKLVRKNSYLTNQNLLISVTKKEKPNIIPISDSDAQEGLGVRGSWYLGGVDGTSGPALLTRKNGFSIYEATEICGITYKNGMSGTGLCYSARIIGKNSDLEINAGSISFEELNKISDAYKTNSIKKFREIVYSVTDGCR
ncbi:hypothetical protein [Pseudogulbenkiania ferrooxidans]|uniref:hypothetical protein n=1 Tax=Pseudogulbenkiania ferrooxidans TaxID=549169 RepID=UPI0012694C2B|nr:hypothetical protein [Pseudogulbenkiania ferrooxidans]